MAGRAVTSSDVARAAGVSPATISLVLSGRASAKRIRVSVATQERVRHVAASLGYAPNLSAQSLRRRRTDRFALVLPALDNPYFAEVFGAAHEVLATHGYGVSIMPARSEEAELAALEQLRGGGADGVVVTGRSPRVIAALRQLSTRGVKGVILQDRDVEGELPSVRVDLARGGLLAGRHLLGLGHRRLAVIVDESHYAQRATDRLQGFQQALREAGVGPAIAMSGHNSLAGGASAMRRILAAEERRPTAVFAFNDLMAAGALRALHEAGVSVPNEIAVVGFDGIALGAFTVPALTTIVHPRAELGATLADLLMRLAQGRAPESLDRVLPVSLLIRESCGGVSARSPNADITRTGGQS